MTGVEIAIWCLHAMSVAMFILTLGLLTLLAGEMLDHARIKRKRESKGPIIGWPREHSNFRSLPVPKIGDVLKFSLLGMELGYAVVAVAREPIPPFKNYWERTFESKWQRDVFIFLGVAEKWTDQAGSRWYGIVLRARDEKVLVFPDYCFEPCHPN